jgi:hypothetical protein
VIIVPRSGWGAVEPKSRTLLNPAELAGVTVHWFGSPKAASSHDGCDDLLRGVQRGHMAPGGLGVPSGGSDIAYNHGVCPHGTVYTLRGFGVKTGANGSSVGNNEHAAIVYMAGEGDPFTDGGKLGLNFLIDEWRKRGAGLEVAPHRRWTGSECPGPTIIAWLAAGRPQPPKEEDVPTWFKAWFEWRLFDGKAATRPSTAPESIPQQYLDIVKQAERFRAEKPGDDAETALLKRKMTQIHTLSAP